MAGAAAAELIDQEAARRQSRQVEADAPRAAGGPVPERPASAFAKLADPGWGGRGNAPARTSALQALQQTYGNRAVQRLLARGLPARMNQQDVQRAPEATPLDDEQQRGALESAMNQTPDFRLTLPSMGAHAGPQFSLFAPGERPQLHMQTELLNLRGFSSMRVVDPSPPPFLPHLLSVPPGAALTPPEPTGDDATWLWVLDFDALIDEESPLAQVKAQAERMQQLSGAEAESAPLGLQLGNAAVNVIATYMASTPAGQGIKERLREDLHIDAVTAVFDPARGNYGLAVTFRFGRR